MTRRHAALPPILRYGRIPISGLPGTGARYAPSWHARRRSTWSLVLCVAIAWGFVAAVVGLVEWTR